MRAYRDEDNVARDSRTETYAALRVTIDNERWRDVPFYLRTGKRMSAHVTTIVLTLRPPTGPFDAATTTPHLLVLGIDPQRGLLARFAAKRPGLELALGPASTAFRYDAVFDEPPNVGYETLLYHAMCGQPLLFQRADMIEHEWAAVQGVLDAWSDGRAGTRKLSGRQRWAARGRCVAGSRCDALARGRAAGKRRHEFLTWRRRRSRIWVCKLARFARVWLVFRSRGR